MNEWKRVRLGDISDMCLGKMLDKEKNKGELQPYLANFNVRWGSFDLTNLNMMRFENSEQERYGLRFGDIIVCEGGEPGRCAIWKEEIPNMKIQKALHRVRIKGDYSHEFVYYRFLLAGRAGELEKHFIGSTIKHLTGIALKEIKFAFPPLNEQQKIAAVLSALDAKIELNTRINAELEAMVKTLYDYWFVQFDFPDQHGKPYKSSGGAMVWNDALKRAIPAGWEVKSIPDLMPILTGKKDANFASENGEYPFFTCAKENLTCDEFAFEGKAILLAGNGEFNVKFYDGKFNAYQRTYVLIPRDTRYFATTFFLISDTITKLTKGSRGSIIKFITLGDIQNIKIALPLKGFDNLFNLLNSILEMIGKNNKENQTLAALRDWLLPLLMNGQASVG